jgi:hypothetical protein
MMMVLFQKFDNRKKLLSFDGPLQGFVWCFLGAVLGCVGGLRPMNVAFALLIFILVFLLKIKYYQKHF